MNHFVKTLILIYGALFGCGSVAWAQEGDNNAGLDVATVQEFDQLDRDRDGKLNEREFAFGEIAERLYEAGKRETIPNVFRFIDGNGDGGIDLMELTRSQLNRNVRLLDRSLSRNYILSDADQDGIITLEEYLKRPDANEDVFGAIDLNDNRKIGPVEWAVALKKAGLEGPQALAFSLLDQNDDGAISAREFEMGKPPEFLSGLFEGIDLNGNRELGPGEFAKAISRPAGQIEISAEDMKAFEEIDRNRDRSISLREFERYSPLPQKGHRKGGPGRGDMAGHIFNQIDENNDREISLSEFASQRSRGGFHGKGKGKGPK